MMKHILLVLMTAILCVALAGCHTGSTFNGNKISETDRFQMDYSVLNQQEGASMALTAGDTIMVSIAQEAGTYQITVTGHNACGSVAFTKVTAAPETEAYV